MKTLVVFSVVLAVAAAQFPRSPFNKFPQPAKPAFPVAQPVFKAQPVFQVPQPAYQTPVVAPRNAGDARSAVTLKIGNEISPDSSYSYFYETDNGIAAQEAGVPKSFPGNPPVSPDVVQGSFSWTSPEGQPISIRYVADENGYQPTGDAIPTPHPIPEAILRSIEYNARNAPRP